MRPGPSCGAAAGQVSLPERLVAVDRGGELVRMVGMVDEPATHDERPLANAVGAPGDRSISQRLDTIERVLFALARAQGIGPAIGAGYLKALGTFGYKTMARGNPVYVQHMPRTLGYIKGNLVKYERFARLRTLLAARVEELR